MTATDRSISIPLPGYRDLGRIAGAHSKLGLLVKCADRIHQARSIDQAAKAIAESVELDAEETEQLLEALMALHAIRRAYSVAPRELLDRFDRSIDEQADEDWKEEHLKNWTAARESLLVLLGEDFPLGAFEKGLQLGYSFQHLLAQAQIKTDLRPVYDSEATKIERAVITFTLTLDYSDGTGHYNKIDVGMDLGDVRELKRLCERAERKAQLLLETIRPMPWPATLVGEEE